jgi:hypothetical protein
MAFDADAATAIADIKAAIGAEPSALYETVELNRLIRLALLVVASGGAGGGGGGTAPSAAALVALSVTARTIASDGAGAVTGGSATIAVDSLGYQIIALTGSFTISGENPTYSAAGVIRGVTRSFAVGKKYPAITVVPAANSTIWIEELS